MYWLICIIIALIPSAYIFINDRKRNIPVKWLPALLRFLVVFSVAALLFIPPFITNKTEEERPIVILLQDESQSIKKALNKDTTQFKNNIQSIINNDLNKAYDVVQLGFGTEILKDDLYTFNQHSTNISQALQAVADQYAGRNIGAVVLLSDGIYNEGAEPLSTLTLSGVPLYTVGIGDSTLPKDIWVGRVYANKIVSLNSKFEIMADINAVKLLGANVMIDLLYKGNPIQTKNITIDKNDFSASLTFEARASEKGFQHYAVRISKLEEEQNHNNNQHDFYVEVTEEAIEILLWAAAPHPDINAINDALDGFPQYKLTIYSGNGIPNELNKYNLVIAHQIPDNTSAKTDLIPPAIPVWYILGSRSNIALFNSMQNTLQINGGNAVNDALSDFQPIFNLFNLPENIQVVLDKAPPLRSPYGVYSIKGNAQVLINQRIGSVSTQYPLWLFKNEETPLAITAGEGLWRWAFYEYKNFKNKNATTELIRQTIALLSVKKDNRPFRIFLDKYVLSENEPVQVFATLKNAAGELINTPEVTLSLTDSMGNNKNFNFDKTGNSYRLNIGLLAQGRYKLNAATQFSGKHYTAHSEFYIQSEPLEFLRSYADFALLSNLSQQTSAEFFTLENINKLPEAIKANENIKSVLHTVKSVVNFIDKRWLFFFIFLFAVAEWLLRKYWSIS